MVYFQYLIVWGWLAWPSNCLHYIKRTIIYLFIYFSLNSFLISIWKCLINNQNWQDTSKLIGKYIFLLFSFLLIFQDQTNRYKIIFLCYKRPLISMEVIQTGKEMILCYKLSNNNKLLSEEGFTISMVYEIVIEFHTLILSKQLNKVLNFKYLKVWDQNTPKQKYMKNSIKILIILGYIHLKS